MSLGAVYRAYLRDEPLDVAHVPDGASAMARIKRDPPQAMLLDLQLPDMDGMDILRTCTRTACPSSVVIITGHGSVDKAVDAMRFGAFDFIEKPLNQKRLIVTLRNAIDVRMSGLVDRIATTFSATTITVLSVRRCRCRRSIASSTAPRRAAPRCSSPARAAPARRSAPRPSIASSDRRDKPLRAVELRRHPARPDGERDLRARQGRLHRCGARSRRRRQAGRRRHAVSRRDREMDLDLQSKLLRFVQTGSFQPVGGTRPGEGGRALHLRHQSRSVGGGRRRALSRGPLLSAARDPDPSAGAA
jgi:two-component system repressor protein LuxO